MISQVEKAANKMTGPAIPARVSILKAMVSRTIIFPKKSDGAAVIAPYIRAIHKNSSKSNPTPNTSSAIKN